MAGNHAVTASLEGEVVVPFKCRHCGHETSAAVKSRGTGEGNPGVFIDGDRAKEHARAGASIDLVVNARLVASMAACPACRTADTEAVARTRNLSVLKAA